MRKSLMSLALAVALLAATAALTMAQEPETGQAGPAGLSLTPQQAARIAQLRTGHADRMRIQQAALIKADAEVQSLRIMPEPDMRALERAMNAASQLRNAQQIQAMKDQQEILGVLTPEQKAQMQQSGRGMMQGRMALRAGQRPGRMARRGEMGRSGRMGMAGRGNRPVGMRGRTGIRRGRGNFPPAGMNPMGPGRGSIPPVLQ